MATECKHLDAYIEPACCSPASVGSSGYVECGCQGRDSIICPDCNLDVPSWELDELYDRILCED